MELLTKSNKYNKDVEYSSYPDIMDVCDCLASILQMSHEVTLSIK